MDWICCPSPNNPVIVPTPKTTRMRNAMYTFAWGEVGVAIGHAFIFGFIMGIFHLVVVWINYTNYATMNFCGSMIVAICAAMEVWMLIMDANDGGRMEAAIFDTKLSQAVFTSMLTFATVKFLVSCQVYKAFKEEHERQFGSFGGNFGSDDNYVADRNRDD